MLPQMQIPLEIFAGTLQHKYRISPATDKNLLVAQTLLA
jgi:hypothetical protein